MLARNSLLLPLSVAPRMLLRMDLLDYNMPNSG
jgi:hypothetical protein